MHLEGIIAKEAKILTDRLRTLFKDVINPAAGFLLKIGLTPNIVTLLGLAGHLAAAGLAASGQITWSGLLILFTAPLDALDGAMARLLGKPTNFGGFFDSVIDRYAEFVLFGGLLLYFHQQGNLLAIVLVYLSVAGSIMVSYTRARAESLGFDAKIGLLSRVERYLVLVPALIFNIPVIGLWIIAVLANLTALQRILHVRHQSVRNSGPSGSTHS